MKYCPPVAEITDFWSKFQNGLPTNRREFIVSQRRRDKFLNCKTGTSANIEIHDLRLIYLYNRVIFIFEEASNLQFKLIKIILECFRCHIFETHHLRKYKVDAMEKSVDIYRYFVDRWDENYILLVIANYALSEISAISAKINK